MNKPNLDEALANMFSNHIYNSDYLFYACMISQCKIIVDNTLPSIAGVNFMHDKYQLFINDDKFGEVSVVNRLAILKHEMLHILNKHITRKEDRNHINFNYATDCAINQLINLNHLPSGAILPTNLIKNKTVPYNLSAEQYYELIENEEDNKDNKDNKDNPDSELMDDHDIWDSSEYNESLINDVTKDLIEKSVQITQKSKGTIPLEISDYIKLYTRKSEINWKKELRLILGNKKSSKRKTIMRCSRRFSKREDIKGTIKDKIMNVLVISDVSGSVDDEELIELLSEVKCICNSTNSIVKLIQVDSKAHEPEELKPSTINFERKSKGGTFLSPALIKAKEHKLDYQVIIVTTDGELNCTDIIEFNKEKVKIFWIVSKNGTSSILKTNINKKSKCFQLN